MLSYRPGLCRDGAHGHPASSRNQV
jgi:hypothetical protein